MDNNNVYNLISQLDTKVDNGQLSLFEIFDNIKHILKLVNAKNARKNYQKFMTMSHITYSARRQLYFHGKQNRKGSGKTLSIKDMPKVIKDFKIFIDKTL